MGLETVNFITDLVITNPDGATDPKSQGDEHLRNIKRALRNSFPGGVAARAVFASIAEMTALAPPTAGTFAFTLGYAAAADGGGGPYYFDPASVETVIQGFCVQADAGGAGRWKLLHGGAVHVRQCGAKGDWDGATGTDDTVALRAWAAALHYAGIELGVLGKGRYKCITSEADVAALFALDLDGRVIQTSGAELVITRDYPLDAIRQDIWDIADGAQNIHFVGDILVSYIGERDAEDPAVGESENATYMYRRGLTFMKLNPNSSNITFSGGWQRVVDCGIGIWGFNSAGTVASAPRRIHGFKLHATRTGYPFLANRGPNDVKGEVWGVDHGRIFKTEDILDYDIDLYSKNHRSSEDAGTGIQGLGVCRNIKARYFNLESDYDDLPLGDCFLLNQSNLPGIIENIDVSVYVKVAGATYFGWAFKCSISNGGPDAHPGCFMRGIKIRGSVHSPNANQRGFWVQFPPGWVAGVNISGFEIEKYEHTGNGLDTFDLRSISTPAELHNITSTSHLAVTGTPSAATPVNMYNCIAPEIVDDSDESYVNLFGCTVFGGIGGVSPGFNYTNKQLFASTMYGERVNRLVGKNFLPVVLTTNLLSAQQALAGHVMLEDAGSGNYNLIAYTNSKRKRFTGVDF